MSNVLSVVVLNPNGSPVDVLDRLKTQNIFVQVVLNNPEAKWKACYLKALWRRLKTSIPNFAVYLFVDTGEGYLSSSPFIDLPDNFVEPAKIIIPLEFRQEVSEVLETLQNASTCREILLFCETTYGPEGSDPEERYINYSITEPISIRELWKLHDMGELIEDTIYWIRS